jgi:outer membrane protein OmpA-like peptidoglycan-associated protein
VITVDAVGEDRPIVPTADGVAEAQNRFVTVMIY